MPQETELKLALHPHDLPRLLTHPLLAAQAPRRERLRNTYFDTASLVLMQQRLAVRERQVGRRTLLTVKTAGHSVGGLSQRGEWEAPTTPGRFDFAALMNDATLAQQLTGLAPQLVPVFRTDFTRRSWLLHHGGAWVEVALDQGFIAARSVQGSRRTALLELELELKSGPVDALLDLAHTLALGPQGQAAQGIWLHPSDRSKAERGLDLFLDRQPAPGTTEAMTPTADLSPRMAFRTVALGNLVHLQAQVSGWLQTGEKAGSLPNPAFVHQARLALRRLRKALKRYGPALPRRFVAHWRGQWQATERALASANNRELRATLSAPAHALNLLAFTRAVLALQDPPHHTTRTR